MLCDRLRFVNTLVQLLVGNTSWRRKISRVLCIAEHLRHFSSQTGKHCLKINFHAFFFGQFLLRVILWMSFVPVVSVFSDECTLYSQSRMSTLTSRYPFVDISWHCLWTVLSHSAENTGALSSSWVTKRMLTQWCFLLLIRIGKVVSAFGLTS